MDENDLFNNENYVDERDEIIKLSINKQLNVGDVQILLLLSEKSALYSRFKRDAIIINGIFNKKNVNEINLELTKFNEETL